MLITYWKVSWIFVVTIHTLMVCLKVSKATELEGVSVKCKEEGAQVDVPLLGDNPCIKCYCENKIVQCKYKNCPSTEGCHNIHRSLESSSCCKESCLGCRYNNITLASGESIQDETNPCITLTCQSGILTKSEDVCYSPCKNPVVIPGKCCPVCLGCEYKRRTLVEGLQFNDRKDPCVRCECRDGNITCKKKACPQLNCPLYAIRQPAPDSCCPYCEGRRTVFKIPGLGYECLYHPLNKLYLNNQIIPMNDQCNNCSCLEGTIICNTVTCPRLNCDPREVIPARLGQCCPTCPPQKRKCKEEDGSKKKHGKKWFRDHCTECVCNDGLTHCWREDCNSVIRSCPRQTHELQYRRGHCCPVCTEVSATCIVFGDPHYRTFDGLLYTFQGTCQYTLAQQCSSKHRSFSIRVQNSAWADKAKYAYTNSVIFNMRHLKVELLQHLAVRVNSRYVDLPYIKLGYISIIQRGYSLIITTSLGVNLVWDGLSYLEVTVPQKYKDKMCGLCGNYNGIADDDFTGRHKTVYTNAVDFGNSWQRSDSSCELSAYNKIMIHACSMTDTDTLSWIHNQCRSLKDYILASECSVYDYIELYYYRCIDQLCSCMDPFTCYCQLATSLLRACQLVTNVIPKISIATSCL